MAAHYRWQRAVLDGSKFGVWLARTLGVSAKIVKVDLTPEEVRQLKDEGKINVEPQTHPEVELPPGMNK